MAKLKGTWRFFDCQIFLLILFSLQVMCSAVEEAQPSQSRSRRSFIDFANMIRCATGRHPFDYLSYGCYCGLGGKGRVLDAVDRCCYIHDNCYRQLRKRGLCSKFGVYLSSYRFLCSTCSSKNKGCSRGLCRCDRQAARCFKRNKYNPKMKNVNKKRKC